MAERLARPPVGGPGPAGAEPTDLPVGELLKRASEQTSRLVREELRLAQLEMQQKAKHVEALAYKADVKSRAHDKADEVKARAEETVERVRAKAAPTTAAQGRTKAGPTAVRIRARAHQLPPPVLAGAAALVLVAVLALRRWRSRRRF